jgi:hypothetical protein
MFVASTTSTGPAKKLANLTVVHFFGNFEIFLVILQGLLELTDVETGISKLIVNGAQHLCSVSDNNAHAYN